MPKGLRLPFSCDSVTCKVWALLAWASITYFLSNRRLRSWQAFPWWSDPPNEPWDHWRPLLWTSSQHSKVPDYFSSSRAAQVITEQDEQQEWYSWSCDFGKVQSPLKSKNSIIFRVPALSGEMASWWELMLSALTCLRKNLAIIGTYLSNTSCSQDTVLGVVGGVLMNIT